MIDGGRDCELEKLLKAEVIGGGDLVSSYAVVERIKFR